MTVLEMDPLRLCRVDKDSNVCDSFTGKRRERALEFLDHDIPRKKRTQTLLQPNETRTPRSRLCEFYQAYVYMYNQVMAARAEETKLRVARNGFLVEEVDKQLKKKMSGTKHDSNFTELPADLREVVERKGGDNLKLVIEKPMTATDLNKINNRFQIPVKKIVCSDFLTLKEKDDLKRTYEQNKMVKTKGGMDVTMLIEPSLEEHNLQLREWPMNNSNNYVLVSGWNSAIKNEKESGMIQEGDEVQLWSFRCNLKLCFLLHKLRHNSN